MKDNPLFPIFQNIQSVSFLVAIISPFSSFLFASSLCKVKKVCICSSFYFYLCLVSFLSSYLSLSFSFLFLLKTCSSVVSLLYCYPFFLIQIVNLIHQDDKLGPSASHSYARSVFSMSPLRLLDLEDMDLDDTFYETMEKEAHHSKVSEINKTLIADREIIWYMRQTSQHLLFEENNVHI